MSLINREDLIAEYDRVHVGPPGGARKLIVDAPEVKPEPKWIPCSERLPEENGEYLVTREARGIYKYVDIVKKTNTSGDIASDIVAWMPLPEPYQEEGEQNGQTSGKPD